jgi:hypothetical protein
VLKRFDVWEIVGTDTDIKTVVVSGQN